MMKLFTKYPLLIIALILFFPASAFITRACIKTNKGNMNTA